MTLDQLLACLNQTPEDDTLWLAVADRLEEDGQDARAELLRLSRRLRGMPEDDERWAAEGRVRELLAGGVGPCVPGVVNSVGMRFALIPAGTFWMGSLEDEAGHHEDEKRHLVTLTRPFWMGVYPVTQGQYQAVVGTNPSYFSKKGDGKAMVRKMDTAAFPVEQVSWVDAVAFCEKLSALPEERACGRSYRLPSEADWEYACRGLTTTPFSFGAVASSEMANFDGNYPYGTAPPGLWLEATTPAGSYPPNAWGLCDMHGNVWEWCHDWYDEAYYAVSPEVGPAGPEEGTMRVVRGGGWEADGRDCRSADRGGGTPSARFIHVGFRVALVPVRPGQASAARSGG